MSDERTVKLESAVRAQATLIGEARSEITRYLAREAEWPELVDRMIRLFDGPQQREAERLAREALGEQEPGNIA